jgi:hypothetical protein
MCFNNTKSFLCKHILNLAKTVQPIFSFLCFKTPTEKVASPSQNPTRKELSKLLELIVEYIRTVLVVDSVLFDLVTTPPTLESD